MGFSPQGNLEGIKGSDFNPDRDTLGHIGQHGNHDCIIFPVTTALTVTLTSHANPHVWSAWAEIADSGATTFSSMITSDTHITGIGIENASVADETWMIEISYGAARTVVARARFVTQQIGSLELVEVFKIHSEHILSGETVYYRLI